MTATLEAIVFTLADGTAREARPILVGDESEPGIMCPFCEYPSEGTSCRNPACDTWCDATRLAERRQAQADREAERERQAGFARFMEAQRAERREREQAAYNAAIGKAREEGYCEHCVSRSLRHGGTVPKFTRHRDAANCPNARF